MDRDFKGVFFPKDIWLNNGLSLIEKALLIEIDSLDIGEDHCFASNGYLAAFADCSVDTVSRSIKKLASLGYILVEPSKTPWGVQRRITSLLPLRKMHTPPPQNADTPPPQNAEHSITPVLRLEKNNRKRQQQERHKHGEYQHVLLSTSELEKLKSKFPLDWSQRIEALDRGIELKGYKYKNFYLAILEWDRRDKQKNGAASGDDSWRFRDPRAERLKEAANAR